MENYFIFADPNAKVAQLVEHDLAKVGVAGSNPVFRSTPSPHGEGYLFKALFIGHRLVLLHHALVVE